MDSSTTRISDLPDPNQQQQIIQSTQQNQITDNGNTNYTPINIHPNPYGISEKNPIMPNPEFTPPSVNNKPSVNMEGMQNMQNMDNIPQQHLPSRDIPSDTQVYTQDPQIQPNFVPPSDKDYFLEDFDKYEKGFQIEEKKEKKKDTFDTIMSHIQIPVLLSIMFYMFNTSIFKTFFLFYIPYKYKFDSDGNLNKTGYLYLSIIFGISYYLINFLINYISDM
tara:strand:- start:2 stop:664 length:663 start_codon:yes stop_codon:yes gene_type:complete